jgi:hypothetical protein
VVGFQNDPVVAEEKKKEKEEEEKGGRGPYHMW